MHSDPTNLELRSLIKESGELELCLVESPVPVPGEDEIIIAMQAAPINPTDLLLLFGPADPGQAQARGSAERPVVTIPVPAAALASFSKRFGKSLLTGSEGAGVVTAAGAGAMAQALLGRTVGTVGDGAFARYRKARAADCLPLPAGVTAAEGAHWFINPMTALGMVGTLRAEGHRALVHTAAASSLGQILVRLCQREGVPLVNIVRRAEQAETLRALGAEHVCDSSLPTFAEDLRGALKATGATLAFDAIGGGPLAGQILSAMEAVQIADLPEFSRYGSTVPKQVYIYGGLDPRPRELAGRYGMAWGVGGWVVTSFLQKAGPARVGELRAQIAAELKTTFANSYRRTLSLAELLQPEIIQEYTRKATGGKFLLDPSR